MKRKWLGLALAAAMAFAGTAWADILAQDSAANYSEEYPFVDGSCGGSGFAGWEFPDAQPTLANSAAGQCGDINSANGMSFRVARDGDHDWCHIYREFDELIPGNTMTLKFTCAWDGGGRGIDLYAGGDQIANAVNLGPGNKLSVNEEIISEDYASKAVYEIAFVQADDGIKLALKRTAEGAEEPFTYSTKISTSKKLSRIGFYAGGWDWNGGENVENYALFVNDLKIEGEAPADRLTLKGEEWVTERTQEIGFTVNRENPEGDLIVSLASSYPAFASVPETVTIPDGEWSAEFTVSAVVQGNENTATISATAEGVAGGEFGPVKGPKYTCVAWEEGVEHPEVLNVGGTRDFYINNRWKEGWAQANDSHISAIKSTDNAVLQITSIGEWQEDESGSYSKCKVTAFGSGEATVEVYYGAKMCEYTFYVKAAGGTLSGPTSIRVGADATYTLDVTLPTGMTDSVGLGASGTSKVVIDPDMAQEIDASTSLTFTVTALNAGTVTLAPYDSEGLSFNELEVTVTEAPDYSTYVAYDDASFYSTGDLDYAATGVGIDGFQAWTNAYKNADGTTTYAGAVVVTSAADSSVLTDGKAFAVYANHSDEVGDSGEEIQLRREFVHALGDGQAFSVVLSPNWRAGTKGVKFMGYDAEVTHEWWPRAEFFYNEDGYYYKLEGDADATVIWDAFSTDAINLTLKKAADGSSYTLTFQRGDEVVAKEGITSFGGSINAVQFYSYQGGKDDAQNFVFNSLAIQQLEEPVPPTPPTAYLEWTAGVWNPDEVDVAYTFGLKSSQDGAIGLVDLTVEPADGIALSADQIDLTAGEATFTVTLTGESLPVGTKYTITAKPQAEGISDATYDLTATAPSCSITPQFATYDYVSGGTVEFEITGTPSRIGVTVDLDSDNEGILMPPSPATAVVGGKFTYTMPGLEEGETYIHARYEGVEWGYAGITINGKGSGGPVVDGSTVADISFTTGFSGTAGDELKEQYSDIKAQILQWNGVNAFDPVGEPLENLATWPDIEFDISTPDAIIQFIFVK